MWQLSIHPVSVRRVGVLFAGITGLVVIMGVTGFPSHSSASSQGFSVLHGQPQSGMIMSLTANPGVIEPANDKNVTSLIGVIAPDETNLDQQAGQINVKTDGAAQALVSTLGGDIEVGDRITASSLAGVGAKTTKSAWIVGVAQASLDSRSKGAIKTSVNDSKGVKQTVYVASLPILVKVTYYNVGSASSSQAEKTSWAPAFLQRVADAIAGRHVSTRALVLSFVLVVGGIFLAAIVINGAIRSGFLAISRQPLAKFVILREVWRSFGLAIIIIILALAGALILLRIF